MIFITGSTGLLGSHLIAELLNNNQQIRAMKRINSDLTLVKKIVWRLVSNPEEKFNTIEWVDGDLLDYQSLEKNLHEIDEVYHCGAVVSFSPEDKDQMMKINIEGVRNIVDAALKCKVKKFCHVSSIASLGRAKEGAVDEDTPWENSIRNSQYSVSKYEGEKIVWEGISKGLNAVIVNPAVILGAGNWNSGSAELFKAAQKGMPFYTFGINGFVDVKDVVRSMILVMKENKFGERFVISVDNISYRKLFTLMAKYLNKKPPYIPCKTWLGEIAWRFFRLKAKFTDQKPLITKETARTANSKHYYSSNKLINATAFQFTPFEQTIKEICEIFKKDLLCK